MNKVFPMKASANENSASEVTDRRSTVEFFLELAKASERWVARIRTVYLWVSFTLMLFFSLLVGLYIPLITHWILINYWIQIVLVILIILAAASAWYYFLRKFDRDTKEWRDKIHRLQEQQKKMFKQLEEKSE